MYGAAKRHQALTVLDSRNMYSEKLTALTSEATLFLKKIQERKSLFHLHKQVTYYSGVLLDRLTT